jgi:hypothetical protein
VPDFLLTESLDNCRGNRDVGVKGTVPDFLLTESLDNCRGNRDVE